MTSASPVRRSGRIPAAEVAAHDAALVEAAGRLFREHGYASTSIDMIAREAQASPKTIYARYGGKLGLFQAMVEGLTQRPLGLWEGLNPEGEPAKVLGVAADRFLEAILSAPVLGMQRALIAEATRLPELACTFYSHGPRRGLDLLAAYLADQHARGRLGVEDPPVAAELFIGLIEGELVRRALFLGETPSPKARRVWLRQALDTFLRAHRAG